MRKRLFRALVMAMVVVLGAACGGRQTPSLVRPVSAPANKGVVHLQYQFTDADASRPPAEFHIFRADSAAGPFQRVNPAPISLQPGQPRPGGVFHVYTDRQVALGRDYFYYLAVVWAPGDRPVKATPVVRATPLIPDATRQEPTLPAQRRSDAVAGSSGRRKTQS